MSNKLQRQKLTLPNDHKKLLLHSCCAPCSGEVMETLIQSGIDFSIFFYNPNIHPIKEYEIRKEENIRFAKKHNIPFIDCDYDIDNWLEGDPNPHTARTHDLNDGFFIPAPFQGDDNEVKCLEIN